MRPANFPKHTIIIASMALTACSSTYKPPVWEAGTTESATAVKAHIDKYLGQYARMMRKAGQQRDGAGMATIFAALAGTTGLALGAGTDFGIVAGSIGSGTTAINNFARPADRLQLLGHAINATTCVRDEYSNQGARVQELSKLTVMSATGTGGGKSVNALTSLRTNAFLERQVDDSGQMAIDATTAIWTSLQMKLANVSQVPNYAAAVKDIQDALELADANTPEGGDAQSLLVEDIGEYEARIATCKAKFPS